MNRPNLNRFGLFIFLVISIIIVFNTWIIVPNSIDQVRNFTDKPLIFGAPSKKEKELEYLSREILQGKRAGDLITFSMEGAYGWTISHHDFLTYPHPVFHYLE